MRAYTFAFVMAVTSICTAVHASENVQSELWRASHDGDVDKIKSLIGSGADPNYVDPADSQGMSPLEAAAYDGHIEAVHALLAAGANPNVTRTQFGGPVGFAAVKRNWDIVKVLIASGANPDQAAVLATASAEGNLEIMKLLLAAHANINLAGRDGPPLVNAVRSGQKDAVQLLIDSHADLGNGAPLPSAVLGGNEEIVKLLLTAGANPTLGLRTAAQMGRLSIVKLLLAKGASPNDRSPALKATRVASFCRTANSGWSIPCPDSAVAAASRGGHADVVNLLLAAGGSSSDVQPEDAVVELNGVNTQELDGQDVAVPDGALRLIPGHHTVKFTPRLGSGFSYDAIGKEVSLDTGKAYVANMWFKPESSQTIGRAQTYSGTVFFTKQEGPWGVDISEKTVRDSPPDGGHE